MDSVQKPNNPDRVTPSSELFRIDMYLNLKQVLAAEELPTSGSLVPVLLPQPGILVLLHLVDSGLTNRC